MKAKDKGFLSIRGPEMLLFGVILEQGVKFVLYCPQNMCDGELFVPKSTSMKVMVLAMAIFP